MASVEKLKQLREVMDTIQSTLSSTEWNIDTTARKILEAEKDGTSTTELKAHLKSLTESKQKLMKQVVELSKKISNTRWHEGEPFKK